MSNPVEVEPFTIAIPDAVLAELRERIGRLASPPAAGTKGGSHDFDKARGMLAPDVKVTATSTNPALPHTDLTGADSYMEGLTRDYSRSRG